PLQAQPKSLRKPAPRRPRSQAFLPSCTWGRVPATSAWPRAPSRFSPSGLPVGNRENPLLTRRAARLDRRSETHLRRRLGHGLVATFSRSALSALAHPRPF